VIERSVGSSEVIDVSQEVQLRNVP